jgi:hypothetical protein
VMVRGEPEHGLEQRPRPSRRDRHHRGALPDGIFDSQLRSGYALPSSRIRRHFLILIDALFSSCLPRSMAFNRLGSRHPFGSRFLNRPNHPIWVWAKKSSGVRVPQRKIIHLAEFFEAIWGVDGHEHVEIPGSR